MWYTLGHEKTHLYPSFDRGRTADPPGGPPVIQCLCVTPLSALARQCPRPDRPRDCRDAGLRRSDGPQCPSCLQYARPGLPAAPVLRAAADPACRLRCAAPRAVTRLLAPESAHLWLPHQPVDVGAGSREGLCRGPHAPAHQWRKHSPRLGMPRCPLEAGQTLDHQSRSRVHPKKKRRDRLMALAVTHPTWGLGCGDEVWWSRLAQPAMHAWAPDEQALRLVKKRGPKPIPSRKRWPAMACWCATSPCSPNRCSCGLWNAAR